MGAVHGDGVGAWHLGELAERIGCVVEGDASFPVHRLTTLEAAGERDLAFLTDSRHRGAALASRAGAVLVGQNVTDRHELARPLLVAEDPGLALIALLGLFHPPPPPPPPGIHPTAVVAAGATIDPSASLGPYVVVGEGSTIGAEVILHPHVVVGRGCSIGHGAVLHPHVVVYDGTELARRVVVHAGAVLGSDGFGYQSRRSGHHKVPQVGRVVVEDDVEIGANSAIDRALVTETRIGAGTKVDNLVQVGHNVSVGRHCLLCGQVGVAGSATVEDWVVLAGQVGVAGHLTIGRGVQVAAKSAVLQSVAPGLKAAGIPAVDLRNWRRQVATLPRLGELARRLRAVEKRLGPGPNENAVEGPGEGAEGEPAG